MHFNTKQKSALAIAFLLVVLTGLFPPYQGRYHYNAIDKTVFIGYRSLFTPPSQGEASRALIGYEDRVAMQYNITQSISLSHFGVQVIVIVIAAAFAVLMLTGQKQEREP